MVSVLILTKNEENDLPECLQSVDWCDDVVVFDSYSDDGTIEIATRFGARITQRRFDNWSSHQNWGLTNIQFKYNWVLYIDADERVSAELRDELLENQFEDSNNAAYEIQRRDFAWDGKWLKHAQMSPFFLRLFRPEKMRYERLVNPVSIVDGAVGKLEGVINHYPFSKGIKFWLTRHLSYADMEAMTRLADINSQKSFSMAKALFSRNFAEKRFHQKGIFYMLPFRPLIKWLYMVVIRRAFLDGKAGLTYSTLQSIYEYFIILRTRELVSTRSKNLSKTVNN